jgi:hypothetical protein
MIAMHIPADTIVNSRVVFDHASCAQLPQDLAIAFDGNTNVSSVFTEHTVVEKSSFEMTVEAPTVVSWTGVEKARFGVLARGEALNELSIDQLIELETLTKLRRLQNYPQTADEILWQRRQEKITRSLVKALDQYVEFHQTSRSA